MTTLRSPALVAVYLGLSLLLVQVHAFTVNMVRAPRYRVERHAEILAGSGKSPYVYRILVPRLTEATRPLVKALGIDNPKQNLEWSYLLWRWVFTFGLLLLFHLWLESWVEPPWVVGGVFLLAALHPPSYLFYWYQPASALDLLLWTAAAVISMSGRGHNWLFPLMLLGGLNRETAVFIPLIYLALRLGREPTGRLLLRTFALETVWLATFVGLRLMIGVKEPKVTPLQVLQENLTHPSWFVYALSFFGVLWLFPLLDWRRLPKELKRLALALTPYLGLQIVFGRIREVRLILPLALVLIPIALQALRLRLLELGPTPSKSSDSSIDN